MYPEINTRNENFGYFFKNTEHTKEFCFGIVKDYKEKCRKLKFICNMC